MKQKLANFIVFFFTFGLTFLFMILGLTFFILAITGVIKLW